MRDFAFSFVALLGSIVLGLAALWAMRTANSRVAAGEERGAFLPVGYALGLVSSLVAIYVMGRFAL